MQHTSIQAAAQSPDNTGPLPCVPAWTACPCLQVFTQLALILLLWGTMCGGLALISDVGVILIDRVAAAQGDWVLPDWVNGRTCMTAVALLVLFPLCLQRHMREVGALHGTGLACCAAVLCVRPCKCCHPCWKLLLTGRVTCWQILQHAKHFGALCWPCWSEIACFLIHACPLCAAGDCCYSWGGAGVGADLPLGSGCHPQWLPSHPGRLPACLVPEGGWPSTGGLFSRRLCLLHAGVLQRPMPWSARRICSAWPLLCGP